LPTPVGPIRITFLLWRNWEILCLREPAERDDNGRTGATLRTFFRFVLFDDEAVQVPLDVSRLVIEKRSARAAPDFLWIRGPPDAS